MGLICTAFHQPEDDRFYHSERPTITFSSNTLKRKQKSVLVNVKIDEVKPQWKLNSSLGTAIACDGECPYMENITIWRFLKAIEIHNPRKIVLNDITITNCSYGVVIRSLADNLKTLQNYGNVNSLFRSERITIRGCHLAIGIFNHSYKAIDLRDINITRCGVGIAVKGLTLNYTLQQTVTKNSSSIASFHLEGIRISKCNTGVYLYSMSLTSVVELQHVGLVDCLYGLYVRKTMLSEVKTATMSIQNGVTGIIIEDVPTSEVLKQSNLCSGGYQNVTFPVEVNIHALLSGNRCAQVGVSDITVVFKRGIERVLCLTHQCDK